MDMILGAAAVGGTAVAMWFFVIPWLSKRPKKRR
jgi:hypothetical protein